MKRIFVFTVFLFFILNVQAKTTSDSSQKKIQPFFKTEYGIGVSSVIYTDNILKHKAFVGYTVNIVAGIQVKNLSFSSGIGLLSIGHKIKDLTIFAPEDNPPYFIAGTADLYEENMYFNIPLVLSYHPMKNKIYPLLEFGLDNLFYLGTKYKYKHSNLPEYKKNKGFNTAGNNSYARKYLPAISTAVGMGIQLKKGFTYEISLNYIQIIAASFRFKNRPDLLSKDFPWEFGIKTGFTYNFPGH